MDHALERRGHGMTSSKFFAIALLTTMNSRVAAFAPRRYAGSQVSRDFSLQPRASSSRAMHVLTTSRGLPNIDSDSPFQLFAVSSKNSNTSNQPASAPYTSSAKKEAPQFKNTGGLRRLPVVPRGTELMNRAQRAVWKVEPDKTIKNAKIRTKKEAAETLDALMKELCTPLKKSIQGYKRQVRLLHPFEKVVTDLTVQARRSKDGLTLDDVLDNINEARKEMLIAGKDWIAKSKNPENTARETSMIMEEGKARLMEQFQELAFKPLDGLIDLQKSLRTVPAIQLDTPAVVLVGCPNVGKSSIVRAISSATPEVNNYPFTTRGMTLGHVEVFWNTEGHVEDYTVHTHLNKKSRRKSEEDGTMIEGTGYAYSQLCQIMDSPGLLVREEEERNVMEELTLAAMRHLPTAVMYVLDLSGAAGDKCSSVEDQLILRREMRARFPRRPWIDVVSKYDLGVVDGSLEKLQAILDEEQCKRDYILLSIQEGDGVEELQEAVMTMLGEVKTVLDAMAAASVAAANTDGGEQRQ